MDLYDKIKMLSEYKPENKRKKSQLQDPKKAALEEMLKRVESY